MLSVVTLIAGIFNKLLELLAGFRRTKESEEAQDDRDKIEADPAGFMHDHFSGGDRLYKHPSREAPDASKTDT